MFKRKAKEGVWLELSHGGETIGVLVERARYGVAELVFRLPQGCKVTHPHLDQPKQPISDLTTPTQPS